MNEADFSIDWTSYPDIKPRYRKDTLVTVRVRWMKLFYKEELGLWKYDSKEIVSNSGREVISWKPVSVIRYMNLPDHEV